MGKRGFGFSILMMAVNGAGIFGSVLYVLDISPGVLFSAGLLTGGLALCGVFFLLLWNTENSRRLMLRAAAFCAVYGAVVICCRGWLADGLSCALQNALAICNERYAGYFVWSRGAALWTQIQAGASSAVKHVTISLLLVLLPFEALMGFCIIHRRSLLLFLENAVWIAGVCIFFRCPPYPLMICAVLGFLMVLAAGECAGDAFAGGIAAVLTALAGGLAMTFLYLVMVPRLDERYKELLEARVWLYESVNEGLVPALGSLFSQVGGNGGPKVSGSLDRGDAFSYTAAELFRITVAERPGQTVYLKGFVGESYEGDAWAAEKEDARRAYYETHGFSLTDTDGEIASLTYEMLRAQGQAEERTMLVEELAGAGNYSFYPYGALLTEGYTVHGDGSVERLGQAYRFSYYSLADYTEGGGTPGVWRDMEQDYRSYVYDSFLDYPEERLQALTAFLEEWNPGEASVTGRVSAVAALLDERAQYNLAVGKTPEGEDVVEYFLLESGEGYCAHFASAGVLLLRYLGIPARYVAGYCAAPELFEKNEDGTWSAAVTGKQAHAWPEIYLDGLGWIPVEVTPTAEGRSVWNGDAQLALLEKLAGEEAAQEQEEPAWEQEQTLTEPAASEEPPSPSGELSADGEREQTGGAPKPGGREEEAGGREARSQGRSLGLVWKLCLAAAAAWGLVLLQRHIRLEAGRKRMRRADGAGQVQLLYDSFRGALALAGIRRDVPVDSEPFWERLSALCPGVQDGAAEFLLALEKSSFSGREPAKEEIRRVAELTCPVMEQVYKGLPFYRKMVYLYIRCYS